MSNPATGRQQWDPKFVLDIYLTPGSLKCSGTTIAAHRNGRRCGWNLPGDTVTQIESILKEMATMQPRDVLRHDLLRKLATLALCEGRKNHEFWGHRDQIDRLLRRWAGLITQAYPQAQAPSPEVPSQSHVHTTLSPQQQNAQTRQAAVPAVSELSSYRLSRPPTTQLVLSTRSPLEQKSSCTQGGVTETALLDLKTPYYQSAACHSSRRQYFESSSMTLDTTSTVSHGDHEKPYPYHRGLLRRMLGCFCC